MAIKQQIRANLVMFEDLEELKRNRWRRLAKIVFFGMLLTAVVFAFLSWMEHSQKSHLQKILLRQQLWQIRNVLIVYSTEFNAVPPDLKSLAAASFKDSNTGNPIPMLENIARDKDGGLIDTFGNPYIYDPASGKVSSVSPCCRDW